MPSDIICLDSDVEYRYDDPVANVKVFISFKGARTGTDGKWEEKKQCITQLARRKPILLRG